MISVRERARRAVRSDVVAIALDLFIASGFDNVTVDDIAREAGMSRRTFHRYFRSKDEVLTVALSGAGDRVAAALAERPVDEPPWIALRAAFETLVREMATNVRALQMTRMMLGSSSTHASHLRKQAHWRRVIADALAPRLAADLEPTERALRADALAAAAIACADLAQAAWARQDGAQSLAALLDQAMGAVAAVYPPP